MAGFVAAARVQDAKLRAAAVLINGGISTTTVTISTATANAVKAVDVDAVAAKIPAGLSNDLLTATIVVYSELVSRTDAMGLFRVPDVYDRQHVDPQVAPNAQQLLDCLGHGTPAARAFPGDLRSLGRLAATLPPVKIAAPSSRAAAEVAVQVASVDLVNGCADECGGTVVRRLPTVRWDGDPSGKSTATGTLGGDLGDFDAKYQPPHGWIINLHVC